MTWKPQVEHQPSQPNTSELVTRLRNYIPGENDDWVAIRTQEAADMIERLADHIDRLTRLCDAYQGQVEAGAARIAELEKALRYIAETPIAKKHDVDERGEIKHGSNSYTEGWSAWEFQRRARAALSSPLARTPLHPEGK